MIDQYTLKLAVSLFMLLSSCALGAERIVSVAPSNTSILLQLGLGNSIVGVSNQCEIPDHLTHIQRVGEFAAINKERVISLKPDLILTSDGIQEALVEQFAQFGLRTEMIKTTTIEEILNSILSIGEWTQTSSAAKALNDELRKKLERIDKKVADIPDKQRPRVFIEMWNTPMTTAGTYSFIHEMITRAGGKNIAAGLSDAYPRVNPEWVVQQNPDIIIIGYQFKGYEGSWKEHIYNRPGWQNVSAIKQKQVYDTVMPEYFLQPGPDVINGIAEFHAIMFK